MSYQLKVIKDNPIGFWPLDELYTSFYSVSTYNDAATTYNEPAYYNSSAIYTSAASDYSGCGNNGTYSGDFTLNDYILPLVSGGLYGTSITNNGSIQFPLVYDYNGIELKGGLATKYTSDNDFTLECWVYPKISSAALTPIFADDANNIGIYYEDGNIVFLLENKRLDFRLPSINQSLHICATYTPTSISLFINGERAGSIFYDKYTFTNSSFLPQVGPTTISSDSFIIDAPAVYRYALPQEKIKMHFNAFSGINPIQIVGPDNGILFTLSEKSIKKTFSYSYPFNKKWNQFEADGLYYEETENYITVDTDLNPVVLYDIFSVPSAISFISSKAEWSGTKGVSVEISTDGTNYTECVNGSAIPGYIYGNNSFSSNTVIYVKITLDSSDISKFFPKLYSLSFNFYSSKVLFADNHGEDIEPEQSNLTLWDYDLSSEDYPVLLRNKNNGIRPYDSGFPINTFMSVRTIEMFFTPISLSSNHLFYHDSAYYSWNNAGVVTKSGISAIYINGVDKTSATNISSFIYPDELYHIVIVLSSAISNKIWFNVKVTGGVWSGSGPRNLYKNIAIYPSAFSSSLALSHYELYTQKPSALSQDTSMTFTENGYQVHNYDWIVVKSI
jgi:hypothetical protein